jgi:hypothetical protein
MRVPLTILAIALLFAAPTAAADDKPLIELTDDGLPLWEIRPLDRHVLIVTLEGKWNRPPDPDAVYAVNIVYPKGERVSQRIDDPLFFKGEVRAALVEYQWLKGGLTAGDKIGIEVTRKRAAQGPDAAEVVSNRLNLTWPLDRPVKNRPPRSQHTPQEPPDAFPGPDPSPEKPPKD